MLKRGNDNRRGNGLDPQRDPALGRLLASTERTAGMMPWSAIERLVADAPPRQVSWWEAWLSGGTRQLRYAVGTAMMLILGTGVLAVMPAHSDQVGTLVLTKLPSAWDIDSAAYSEVKADAHQRFDALAVPQGDLFMVIGERSGRDELALAMVGIDSGAARDFFDGLCETYPALDAFDVEYQSINSERFGNRLNEVLYRISHRGDLGDLADAELSAFVIKALNNSGFADVRNVTIERMPDGRIIIKVEATLDIAVEQGRLQEELEAVGLSQELLGNEAFEQLLSELGTP